MLDQKDNVVFPLKALTSLTDEDLLREGLNAIEWFEP